MHYYGFKSFLDLVLSLATNQWYNNWGLNLLKNWIKLADVMIAIEWEKSQFNDKSITKMWETIILIDHHYYKLGSFVLILSP